MHLCVCVGQICQLIQGISAKFSCQLSVPGWYICWQIQGRSAKNLAASCQDWGVHLLADLGQICQIQLLVVSTGWYICWRIQGRSAKFSCQVSVLGGTSADRSRVDLQNLATKYQYWGETSASRSEVDLPNLGTRCQQQGVHLPADVGQFCQIWPPDTSTGGISARRSRVDLPNLATQIPVLGGTSAGRSRVDLPNLATRCQYWGENLPADLGQICQIQLLVVSTGQYICWQIQGRSAKFSHQVSVQGEHLLADVGQICQIQPLGVSTGGNICWQIQGRSAKFRHQMSVAGGTSAGRCRVDLPNLATRYQYWGYICKEIQGRSAKFGHQIPVLGVHLLQIQGRSAKFSHQVSVLGGTSASSRSRCQYWGYICGRSRVDLPMCIPTSILHVKLGKYDLSELKSFIIIWGVFGGCFGVSRGCYI